MRTNLDHLPEKRQRDLRKITNAIKAGFEHFCAQGTQAYRKAGRIEKIILFGSFVGKNWVDDLKGDYLSDYDILVIINERKLVEAEYWWELADKFLHRVFERKPEVNILVETLSEVNRHLGDGMYFFVDIYEEGVVLFERSRSAKLRTPQPLNAQKALEVADKHFDIWLSKAKEARKSTPFFRDNESFRWEAFMIHQTFEASYACLMLVITNYLPATHNIQWLGNLVAPMDERLTRIWPGDTKFRRRTFQRIKRAYVEARYSEHYEIANDEMDWATERADLLLVLVEEICLQRLEELATGAGWASSAEWQSRLVSEDAQSSSHWRND